MLGLKYAPWWPSVVGFCDRLRRRGTEADGGRGQDGPAGEWAPAASGLGHGGLPGDGAWMGGEGGT
ncbi:hypothetical protein ACWFRM_36855, partial [Streptomyces sp. NPDC055144]